MYNFPFELDDFQKEACECISNKKSVVVTSGTGSGKTECFMYPILDDINKLIEKKFDNFIINYNVKYVNENQISQLTPKTYNRKRGSSEPLFVVYFLRQFFDIKILYINMEIKEDTCL